LMDQRLLDLEVGPVDRQQRPKAPCLASAWVSRTVRNLSWPFRGRRSRNSVRGTCRCCTASLTGLRYPPIPPGASSCFIGFIQAPFQRPRRIIVNRLLLRDCLGAARPRCIVARYGHLH
jgi:hypothetical protein